MKFYCPIFFFCCLFTFLSTTEFAAAQSNNKPSSSEPHEIKITGYLQMQYQKAASSGIESFSGGEFDKNSSERFMIRRGRLKIDRVDKFTNVVFQIDATQNGVQLMDAFIQIHTPNNHALTFTAGLFNRPFGHSIAYSSGYRDFPERARVFQTLMPRERDLGAMISFTPKKILPFLVAELGIVNGAGIRARDYDSKKDLVGSLAFQFDSLANKKMHLGFGSSFYAGTVRSNDATVYNSVRNQFTVHTNAANVGRHMARNYYGVNLQLRYDTPFGATTLKSEYVEGVQPGVAGTASLTGPMASQSFGAQPATSLYQRNFNGYFLWLSHEIAATGLTALLAYDFYDPNTDLSGTNISLANNATSGDIKYKTVGYGLAYHVSKQVKFTFYNEHVTNENTAIAGYTNDLSDNVFTARLQYRW